MILHLPTYLIGVSTRLVFCSSMGRSSSEARNSLVPDNASFLQSGGGLILRSGLGLLVPFAKCVEFPDKLG